MLSILLCIEIRPFYHFGKEVAELKGSLPSTEPKYPNKDVLKQSLKTVMDYLNKRYGNNIVAQSFNDKHSYNRKRVGKNIKGFWTISDWDGDYIATKAIYKIESYSIADYTDIE